MLQSVGEWLDGSELGEPRAGGLAQATPLGWVPPLAWQPDHPAARQAAKHAAPCLPALAIASSYLAMDDREPHGAMTQRHLSTSAPLCSHAAPPCSDAADLLMDDLFARLKEVSSSGVLPYDEDQAVSGPKPTVAGRLGHAGGGGGWRGRGSAALRL